MKTILSIILGIAVVTSVSCNKENNCTEYRPAYFDSVNGPNTGIINENIVIEIQYWVSNGCGGDCRFIEKDEGLTRLIELEAEYQTCSVCTQTPVLITTEYKFMKTEPGEYELKFNSSPNGDFTTLIITIE